MRFKYHLIILNDYICLIDRETLDTKFRSIGFSAMYWYIKKNNIDFKDIRLKNCSFYDLFNHYIDESSLNKDIKKESDLRV